jgi:hypothetical protein
MGSWKAEEMRKEEKKEEVREIKKIRDTEKQEGEKSLCLI